MDAATMGDIWFGQVGTTAVIDQFMASFLTLTLKRPRRW